MSDSNITDAEPAPEGCDEFIADLNARVQATQRQLEAPFPDTVVTGPDADDFPEGEIARIDS
ncbi:hypothetical protein [Promicromonospora soli]